MTSITGTDFGAPIFSGLVKRIKNAVKRIRAKLKRRADINATINQLHALTDRELNDMGLSRCDIYTVAHSTTDIRKETV